MSKTEKPRNHSINMLDRNSEIISEETKFLKMDISGEHKLVMHKAT